MTKAIALHCMKADSELHNEMCEHCDIYGETGTDHCFSDAQEMAIKALEQMTEWIPADKELPEEGEMVLCWYEYFRFGDYNRMYQTFGIGYQYDGHWGGEVSSGVKAKVLYWMELPEPPEGAEIDE